MPTRKLARSKSPSEAQVAILGERVASVLGLQFMAMAAKYKLDPEAFLRFGPVAERCRLARESQGLSVKQAAERLKVPQYRIRDIENNQPSSVDPAVALSYSELLGLGRWYAQWLKRNQGVYASSASSGA